MKGSSNLSFSEEVELIRKAQSGCFTSRDKLLLSHERFIKKIAKGHTGRGVPFDDLVQEGFLGMIEALKKFDLKEGVRFLTFAKQRIVWQMLNAIGNYDCNLPYRVSKTARTKKNATYMAGSVSLFEPIGGSKNTFEDVLYEEDFLKFLTQKDLTDKALKALENLSVKKREVLEMKYGLNGKELQTVREIRKKMSASRESVNGLVKRAIETLRIKVGEEVEKD